MNPKHVSGAAFTLRADPIFTAARLREQVGPNQTTNFLWRIDQPSQDFGPDSPGFFLFNGLVPPMLGVVVGTGLYLFSCPLPCTADSLSKQRVNL